MSDNSTGTDNSGSRPPQNEPPSPPKGLNALIRHIQLNLIDVTLWVSRILTLVFAIAYIIPIFG